MPEELNEPERRARLADHVTAERAALGARLRRLGLTGADLEDALADATAEALRDVGQVRDWSRLPAWFARIVRRAGLRVRAAQRREVPTSEPPEPAAEAPAPSADGCRCAPLLLARLPATTRALVERVDVHDRAVGEVAQDLGLTPNAASVRLFRARGRLRALVLACCGARSAAEADAACVCAVP